MNPTNLGSGLYPIPPAVAPIAPPGEERERTPRDHLDRLMTLLARSWRFRWYAALVLLLGATVALAVALMLPRSYTSETLIVYREGIGARAISGDQNSDAQQKLALKLKEMVLSRTSLQKIIDEFHLYPRIMDRSGYVDAVNEMRKNIAFAAKDGETFGLSFTGPEPAMVQKLTARLAQDLVTEQSKSRLEQAGETREFIDAEKHRSDEDLKDKEGNLATFIAKHPEFAKESNGVNAGTQAGIAIRAMNKERDKPSKTSDPQLAALEREASRIAERLGTPIKRKPDKELDPKLAAARAEAENDLKAAQRELAEKAAQFTEEHPDVRAAKTRVKSADAKLRHVNEAIASVDGEKKTEPTEEGAIDRGALETELKRVQEEISQYKRRRANDPATAPQTQTAGASAVVELETEWTRLNREVGDARERNQQLEARQFKASIMENAVTSGRNAQMIIVDPAYKPTHPNKGRTQVVIAGVAAAVGLALMLALLLTMLDDRLYDRVDIESLKVAPLLGVIPKVDGERDNRG